MSEITYTESDKAVSSMADATVKVIRKPSYVPSVKKFQKISVLGKKTGTNGDIKGEEISVSDISSKKSKLSDGSELNFTGKVKLYNGTLTQEDFDDINAYGGTLVVLSEGVSTIKTNSSSLNYGDLIIWYVETATTTTLKDIINAENRGAFLDVEKKGHTLYAVSKLLEDPMNIKYSAVLTSSDFKGVTKVSTADSLDELGYSYFFKSTTRCWAKGFWLGKLQARAVYMDLAVRYDVKEAIAGFISEGISFTRETLRIMEAKIVSALEQNLYVENVVSVSFPHQPNSQMVKGIVQGVDVRYRTLQEIRSVTITIRGGV